MKIKDQVLVVMSHRGMSFDFLLSESEAKRLAEALIEVISEASASRREVPLKLGGDLRVRTFEAEPIQ